MTNIKMGEDVLCINAKGSEDTGLQYGAKYVANNVMVIPGQGDFVGVFVESVGQIIVVDAARFEKAYTLNYRILHDEKKYLLIDESWNEEEHEDDTNFMDVSIVLPESQLENIEEVLNNVVAANTLQETGDEEAS